MQKKMKPIYLVQTDTTVGFLCEDFKRLNEVKNRPLNTPCVECLADFSSLKQEVRVPKGYRKFVRYAKKTTFIYKNKRSFRVVKDAKHSEFVAKFKGIYSTSANLSGKGFDIEFAKQKADIIIENKNGFFEAEASCIFKFVRGKKRRLR